MASDLIETFEEKARELAAGVCRVRCDAAQIRQTIHEMTRDAASVAVGAGEFLPDGIVNEIRSIPGALTNPTGEQLARAEVGICGAFAGVASAGSVCIALGPPLVNLSSLLMPLHIVLLDARRIVARPRNLFDPDCFGGEGLRRNLVFVTGPSATADMGPLVRGVHGPHRLQIVLIG